MATRCAPCVCLLMCHHKWANLSHESDSSQRTLRAAVTFAYRSVSVGTVNHRFSASSACHVAGLLASSAPPLLVGCATRASVSIWDPRLCGHDCCTHNVPRCHATRALAGRAAGALASGIEYCARERGLTAARSFGAVKPRGSPADEDSKTFCGLVV